MNTSSKRLTMSKLRKQQALESALKQARKGIASKGDRPQTSMADAFRSAR